MDEISSKAKPKELANEMVRRFRDERRRKY